MAAKQKGKVISVNVSESKGTKKTPVECIVLSVDFGIIGDAHAGDWHRQVSLLGVESIKKLAGKFEPGDFAENITTKGLELYKLPVGTRLQIGEVELQMTQIGKECHKGCEIKKQTGDCVMPREGVFAKVNTKGKIYPKDKIEVLDD